MFDTKPAGASKINWTQVVAAAAALFAVFGIDITAEQQRDILLGIVAIDGVVTVVLRTWFTTKLTPQSRG